MDSPKSDRSPSLLSLILLGAVASLSFGLMNTALAQAGETVGLYSRSDGSFYLTNNLTGGTADLRVRFDTAGAGEQPLAGDWNGDGVTTIGLYSPATSTFSLRNSNTDGSADARFGYGPAGAGWQPLAGDWNGDGVTTIGLYSPATSTFYLRNSNTGGSADVHFGYGPAGAGWQPLAGDWDGDGNTTIGLYHPVTSTFFLRNNNTGGIADLRFGYGPPSAGWLPVTGYWGSGIATTFTVSGTIAASDNATIDRDVNDPNASYMPNDSLEQAQPLPNPTQVGGYLNAPFTGPSGASFSAGDLDDYYVISLQAGQQILLVMGDYLTNSPYINDLDLYLYDANGGLVDTSMGTTSRESLKVAAAGRYYIRVRHYAGASTYVMSVGQQVASGPLGSPSGELHLSAEFQPGEVIARYSNKRSSSASGHDRFAASTQALGLLPLAGTPQREMLLGLGETSNRARAFDTLGASTAYHALDEIMGSQATAEKRTKLETLLMIKALRTRPEIETAEPNYIRHAQITPTDEFYPYQWHYPLINLPQAWDITTGSSNVTVAVIDTGVLLNHPDLQGRLIPGYDFISDALNALDGDGIDPNPNDPGDQRNGDMSSFHGTHVAGTIAATSDNDTGIAGVDWNAKIMPLRVLGRAGGTTYDIMQAVRYAAGLPNDSGQRPSQRADIINLSLSGPGGSQAAQDVYHAARNQGVIIIAAAGNENTSTLAYPASYDGVVSVSAVDLNKHKAPYSNFGARIDVAAPGGDLSVDRNGDGFRDGVLSTLGKEAIAEIEFVYNFYHGTSMAAPHVAGVAALMKARSPDLSPQDFDALLASGEISEDLGSAGRDDLFGHGLIDARKAVANADTGSSPSLPTLVSTPSAMNFGSMLTNAPLQLANGGEGSLVITNLSDNAGWLEIAPSSVDHGLGTYTVQVNRNGLAAGSYSARIAVTSTANNLSIPVLMEVAGPDTGINADAGYQYVLLADPDTLETRYQAQLGAVNGAYRYRFEGEVAAGRYLLFSGTDSDYDGFICEVGESCGAYPTQGLPTPIEVDQDRSGIDFVVSFIDSIPATSTNRSSDTGRPWLQRLPINKQIKRR